MENFTEGNIVKKIIKFVLPILLGIILQRFYNLVDTMLVGRFVDTESLAAVGSVSIVFTFFINACWAFTSGFSIIIGQRFGAGDEKGLKQAMALTYVFSIAIGIIISLCGVIFIEPILTLIKVPPELFSLSKSYLVILIAGIILSLIYNMLSNVLRALGDSVVPLIFLCVSVILNFFMDLLFIVVLKKGVEGAAIATVISQALCSLGVLIFALLKRPELRVSRKDFVFEKSMVKNLFGQGTAMALMIAVVDSGSVILQAGINSLGAEIVAGFTAGRRYLELFMMPGGAFANGAASFVSQNYGAKKYDRIETGINKIILLCWALGTVFIAICYIFGRSLVTSITGTDVNPEIINYGVRYLKLGCPFYYCLYILVVVRSSLQGINRKKVPVIASIIELVVKIGATYFFVPRFGFIAVCFTEPVIWILGMIWVYSNFRLSVNKLKKSLIA